MSGFPCRLLSVIALSSALLLSGPASAGGESEDGFQQFGDIMQILLPAGAGLSTLFVGDGDGSMWDREGTLQFAKSFGTAWSTTYVLKTTVQKMRPDQGARSSFPSGHTMGAFSGASFVGARYGWKWGVPSYTLAALVGVSRITSSWHFADDVVAGASISMLSTWMYTTPHPGRIQARPTLDDGGVGIAVTINGPGRRSIEDDDHRNYLPMPDRRFRYGFTFGPAMLIRNEVSSPGDAGTTFDLESFEKRDDPTTTALASFDWFVNDRWTLNLFYGPFESQDTGQFSEPVEFAGATFPADTPIESAWRLHDLRTRATFDWIRGERFGVTLGAGVIGQLHHVRLSAGGVSSQVDDLAVLPYVHARLSYSFLRRWSLSARADWMEFQSDRMLNGTALVGFQIDPRWEVVAGYQFYDREIDNSELRNRVSYDLLMLGFAHSWK